MPVAKMRPDPKLIPATRTRQSAEYESLRSAILAFGIYFVAESILFRIIFFQSWFLLLSLRVFVRICEGS